MSLPVPKFNIGDTVFTSSYTVEDVICETCKQPTYADEDDDWLSRRVILVKEQVVQGCGVRLGISETPDGVVYQLSKDHWTVAEDSIFATAEEAQKVVEDELKELVERKFPT